MKSTGKELSNNYRELVKCTVPEAYSSLLSLPLGSVRAISIKWRTRQEVHSLGGRISYPAKNLPQDGNLVEIGRQLYDILMKGSSYSAIHLKPNGKKPIYNMESGQYYAFRTMIRIKVAHPEKKPQNQIKMAEAIVLAYPRTGEVFAWFVE